MLYEENKNDELNKKISYLLILVIITIALSISSLYLSYNSCKTSKTPEVTKAEEITKHDIVLYDELAFYASKFYGGETPDIALQYLLDDLKVQVKEYNESNSY